MTSSTVQPITDAIESFGAWTPDSPGNLHDTIRNLHHVTGAVGDAYHQIAGTLGDMPGVHPAYGEALEEAAAGHHHAADVLENRLSPGVLRPGATDDGAGSQANTVAGEVAGLGNWDPDSAGDVHDTLQSLHEVTEATSHAYRQIAETLRTTGTSPGYADHLDETAAAQDSIEHELSGVIGGGLLHGPNG